MSKTIQQMQAEVVQVERDLGWTGPGVDAGSFGDRIALLHSEVSEALEAYRRWGVADATEQRGDGDGHGRWCKAHGWAGPCPSEQCPLPKPEGVGSEFADVFIRLLTECERFGVDLDAEYERKVAYNRTRPVRHGGKAL